MKIRISHVLMIAAIFSSLLLQSIPLGTVRAAGACSWNGSFDANWSNPGNWGGGCSGTAGIPGTGDALTFPTGASNTTMNDDLPGLSLQGLTFTSSLGYTINGANTISLTTGIDVQGGNQTINTPLAVLNNGLVFHVAPASLLVLGGAINLNTYDLSANVDTAAGVTGLRILGTVSDTTPSDAKISKNGTGDLRFIGTQQSSHYDIDLNAGSISTNPSGWTFLPMYGMITLAAGTNLNLLSAAMIGPITGSGTIHSSGTVQIRQSRDTIFNGDISGSDQLYVLGQSGSHQLTIDRSGASLSYSGTIDVGAGAGPARLNLVNTTALDVPYFILESNGGGAVLELNNSHVGEIRLGFPDPKTVYSGTLILSGTTANEASQVTVQTAGCSIGSVINSASDYGRLDVTFPVDLGSSPVTFTLSGSYALKTGEVLNIIHNIASGTATRDNATFSGLPQGDTVTFNSVELTANYQDAGNTTFALRASGMRIYLPLILR